MEGAYDYLLKHTPAQYERMLSSNHSFGLESDERKLRANNDDFRKCMYRNSQPA